MFCKKLLHAGPHFLGEHVAGFGFDEGRKVFRHTGLGVGLGNGFDAGAGFLNWGAAVGFAEVQVQGARSDEGGDVRRVAVGVDAGDEVRETMQQLGAVEA